MKRMLLAVVICGMIVASQAAFAGTHSLGAGARYNTSVGNISGDFDKDGLSWLVSYQYAFTLLKLEADVEILPTSLTGADKMMLYPQAYALLGGLIYGGLGIGVSYYDGDFGNDPIYNLRAGLDMGIIPDTLRLDINANYGFTDFDQIKDFDADNITIAALVRYSF